MATWTKLKAEIEENGGEPTVAVAAAAHAQLMLLENGNEKLRELSAEERGALRFTLARIGRSSSARVFFQRAGERAAQIRAEPKVGRNAPCPCGSGLKYKKCHGKEPQ